MDVEKNLVAIGRYEKPGESVRRVVELSQGLKDFKPGSKVFIKPNIVFWTKEVLFPKWGVITTSRVIEDMVALLKDLGAGQIVIGEGAVSRDPKNTSNMEHAFEYLGYNRLKERYGVQPVNVFTRPFSKLEVDEGQTLNFAVDAVESDLIVDLPVMKTHAQTVVSLGLKNLKGLIDVPSRKKCHGPDPNRDLNYWVARLAEKLPPVFALLDGIYTNERGPVFDGRIHRADILVASRDLLSADLVGSRLLGHDPAQVPHLVNAARNHGRALDLSQVELLGESIESLAQPHEHDFPYTPDGKVPMPLVKLGVQGLTYPKYDLTMCTYCSGLNGPILTAIAMAWKGQPWNEIEVLTGKVMQPTPGKQKTVLLGKCMCQAQKDNPEIKEAILINGCPPKLERVAEALSEAGIEINPAFFANLDKFPGTYMKRYQGKTEFEESHFQVA